jgi:hypothetical protein
VKTIDLGGGAVAFEPDSEDDRISAFYPARLRRMGVGEAVIETMWRYGMPPEGRPRVGRRLEPEDIVDIILLSDMTSAPCDPVAHEHHEAAGSLSSLAKAVYARSAELSVALGPEKARLVALAETVASNMGMDAAAAGAAAEGAEIVRRRCGHHLVRPASEDDGAHAPTAQ